MSDTDAYFLRSARLAFRWWTPDDVGLAMELWGDPRVTAFIGGPLTEQEVRERLDQEIALQRSDGVQYWPIFRRGDEVHVGCCGLRPYKPEERMLEIGCHIRSEHWGQGYASESARAVMQHAFRTLGVRALFAGHHPRNDVSRRLLHKLGFEYTHDELYPPTGLKHPSYIRVGDA